jgi:hypothetical protein
MWKFNQWNRTAANDNARSPEPAASTPPRETPVGLVMRPVGVRGHVFVLVRRRAAGEGTHGPTPGVAS